MYPYTSSFYLICDIFSEMTQLELVIMRNEPDLISDPMYQLWVIVYVRSFLALEIRISPTCIQDRISNR